MYRRVDRETALRTIRVETSAATILLTEAPEPKVRDRQTGEIAKDAVSGEGKPSGRPSVTWIGCSRGGPVVSDPL
jgi:hypothetical protein